MMPVRIHQRYNIQINYTNSNTVTNGGEDEIVSNSINRKKFGESVKWTESKIEGSCFTLTNHLLTAGVMLTTELTRIWVHSDPGSADNHKQHDI